ncbi:MAG: pantetheine-phosphate adenylyltransferase [Gammaproteobacteria bacterium]|jgi:pantetheine-phosphate adenylyltransferase
MKITAIYPGTFDPITNGHVDIVTRASRLFDKVFLAVADSTAKKTLFSTDERIDLAKSVLLSLGNVEVCSFDKLVTDIARELDAKVIIRGIRAAADFDYEFQMAGMNRSLYSDAETIFLRPAEHLSFISSTLVREISSLGGEVSQFVDKSVLAALDKKFPK